MFKLGKGSRLSIVPPLLSKRSRTRLSKPPPARNISTETERAQTQSQIVSPTDSDVTALLDKFKDPNSHFYLVPGTPGPSHEDDHSTSRAPGTPIAPPTPITPGATIPQEEVVPPVPSVPAEFPKHTRTPSNASINRAEVEGRARSASSTSQHRPDSALGRTRGTSITSKVELVNGGHSRKGSSASIRQRNASVSSSHSRMDSAVSAPIGISVAPATEGSETLVGAENEPEMPGSHGKNAQGGTDRPSVASATALPAVTANARLSPTELSSTGVPAPIMTKQERSRVAGNKYFKENGYDDIGVLEWPVAWGDCDMFQHANNVQFVRWFESARIKYGEAIAPLLPEGMMKNMLRGKGNGIILKDISIKYRLPVTYPDTLLIASKPHSINQERGCYGLASAFWSIKSGALVATGDSTIVFYDYDNLKKGFMPDTFRDVLTKRQRGEEAKAP